MKERDAPCWSSTTIAPIIISDDRGHRQRAAAADRAAADQDDREAGDDQSGAEHRRAGQPECEEQRARPRRQRARRRPRAAGRRRRPRVRSRGGSRRRPRARGSRRRGGRASASTPSVAASPPQTPAMHPVLLAACERQDRDLRHPARTMSMRPAPTLAWITSGSPWSRRTWRCARRRAARRRAPRRPSSARRPPPRRRAARSRGARPTPTEAFTGVRRVTGPTCERSMRRSPTPRL